MLKATPKLGVREFSKMKIPPNDNEKSYSNAVQMVGAKIKIEIVKKAQNAGRTNLTRTPHWSDCSVLIKLVLDDIPSNLKTREKKTPPKKHTLNLINFETL